ncbi:MAG TPA: DMT family transporter [Caulobacterales bacterium]|nr:DMT family transporter [Caulobacterales bacterium]
MAQLIAVAAIWGVNNVAAKVALSAFPPMMTVALRFGVVLVVLAPWLKPVPREAVRPLATVAILMGPLHFGLLYFGIYLARDLGPMIIAMQLWAPFSVVFAGLILKEPSSPLRLAGVAVAFAGVASMTFDPVVFAQGPALALIACASAIYALGTISLRRLPSMNTWTIQAWLSAAITPTMILGSAAFEHGQLDAALHAGWTPWACAMFGAVASSLVANYMLFRLVQRYEVARTTPYLLLAPLVSFALSAAVLHDRITAQIAAGGAAALAGVLLVAAAEKRFAFVFRKQALKQ